MIPIIKTDSPTHSSNHHLLMLRGRMHQVVGLFPCNGWVLVGRIANVFDRHEQCHVGTNAHHPAGNTLSGADILAVKIQSQFWGTRIVKETVMILDELQEKEVIKRQSMRGMRITRRHVRVLLSATNLLVRQGLEFGQRQAWEDFHLSEPFVTF